MTVSEKADVAAELVTHLAEGSTGETTVRVRRAPVRIALLHSEWLHVGDRGRCHPLTLLGACHRSSCGYVPEAELYVGPLWVQVGEVLDRHGMFATPRVLHRPRPTPEPVYKPGQRLPAYDFTAIGEPVAASIALLEYDQIEANALRDEVIWRGHTSNGTDVARRCSVTRLCERSASSSGHLRTVAPN